MYPCCQVTQAQVNDLNDGIGCKHKQDGCEAKTACADIELVITAMFSIAYTPSKSSSCAEGGVAVSSLMSAPHAMLTAARLIISLGTTLVLVRAVSAAEMPADAQTGRRNLKSEEPINSQFKQGRCLSVLTCLGIAAVPPGHPSRPCTAQPARPCLFHQSFQDLKANSEQRVLAVAFVSTDSCCVGLTCPNSQQALCKATQVL